MPLTGYCPGHIPANSPAKFRPYTDHTAICRPNSGHMPVLYSDFCKQRREVNERITGIAQQQLLPRRQLDIRRHFYPF